MKIIIKLKNLILKNIDSIYNYLNNKKILKVIIFWLNFFLFTWLIYHMYLASYVIYIHQEYFKMAGRPRKGFHLIIWGLDSLQYWFLHPITWSIITFPYLWCAIIVLIIDLGYLYYKHKWYIFTQRSKIKYLFYILFWIICTSLFYHFTAYVFFIGYEDDYTKLPEVWSARYHTVNIWYFIISVTILIKKLWDESDISKKPYKKRSIDFRF